MNEDRLHLDRTEWRWPRLFVIATAAVILASCRSITQPLMLPLAAVAVAPEESAEATREPSNAVVQASAVVQTGCEAPCPPLPRRLPLARGHFLRHDGPCDDGNACQSCNQSCNQTVCMPLARPVPMVGPCLVCDGGDARAPAMPVARFGLKNLTSGDTVARYRADDDGPDSCDVHVTASNCACVYAPRFGSVRQVTRPHEDARPIGPRGLAIDVSTEAKIDLQPVCRSTQSLAPEAARKALPGVALEERLGPLAVDQGDPIHESNGLVQPVEDVRDEQLERAELVQTPRMMVGFDVPLAWTCARAAMVMVGRQQAEVVAADRGTATLRLESPGRAELTLCKRAGSDTARVGEELDFTIYLYNSGDRSLTDIVLVDALPGRLEFVPGSAAANQPAEFATDKGDDGSVVLKWQFQHTFKPGEGGFVRFRTVVR
jgi:uncharacterized repeat protein (TIGR01451 family)